MAKKVFERVCVLAGRQEWEPHTGECRSRIHGHLTVAKANALVNDGRAEWVYEVWTDLKNKEHKRMVPCIKLLGRKRWKGKMSFMAKGVPIKVMQLVNS